MKQINIHVKFYGMFRRFGDAVTVKVDPGTDMIGIKNALMAALGEEYYLLVGDSVLADDDQILPENYVLTKDGVLSILPPVCGG